MGKKSREKFERRRHGIEDQPKLDEMPVRASDSSVDKEGKALAEAHGWRLPTKLTVMALLAGAISAWAANRCLREDEDHVGTKTPVNSPKVNSPKDEVVVTESEKAKASWKLQERDRLVDKALDLNDFLDIPEKIGPITFIFSSKFTPEEKVKLLNLIQKSFEYLQQYLPMPEGLAKTIRVAKSPSESFSLSSYAQGNLWLDAEGTEGIIIHELVHLYHGNNDTHVNYIEEGLATAISNLITDRAGLESWDKFENLQLNQTLQDGGLTQMSYVPYDFYRPLLTLRYYYAARLWMDLEKQIPGSILKFHRAYYKLLSEGMDRQEMETDKVREILEEIGLAEAFEKIRSQNPVMRFNPKLANKNLIYMYYLHASSDVRGIGQHQQIMINIVNKDGHGAEKSLGRRILSFQVENVGSGQLSRPLELTTDQEGSARVDLDVLRREVGDGSKYRIHYSSPGITERPMQFEFKVK